MPDRLLVGAGLSVAWLVGLFFYIGGHHEIRYRLRQRKRGGMLP